MSDSDAPNGRNYFDALTTAGQRTRSFIYLILLVVVLTFTATRANIDPSWTWNKAVVYGNILQCLKAKAPTEPGCQRVAVRLGTEPAALTWKDVTELANDFDLLLIGEPGAADFTAVNEVKLKEISLAHETMLRKAIDQSVLSIPLFGAQIDYEDLWLVSAVAMVFLLFLLWSSVEQEYRVARHIADRRPNYLELMLITHDRSWLRAGKGASIVRAVCWLVPTIGTAHLLYSADLFSFELSGVLGSTERAIVEYAIEIASFFLLAYLNVRSLLAEMRLQRLLHELRARVPDAAVAVA